MTEINVRRVVRCPNREAARHLAAFIAEHSVADGTIGIALRLPVKMFAEKRPLPERRVLATLYPLAASSDPHPTYAVSWAPKTRGLFPQFDGALAIEKSDGEHCFGLVVNGRYAPPHAAGGTCLDDALGRRIAQASARDLLYTIADHIEYASAHDEAARAGSYRAVSPPPAS